MVCLDVGPEPLPQVVGQCVYAGVVQRGLTLPQVVHQQVTDRAADQPVAVDQLLGGPLPAGAQLPQRPGRLLAQDAELAQGPVEQRAAGRRVGPRPVVLGITALIAGYSIFQDLRKNRSSALWTLVVFGGIGNLAGAMLGGLLLGLVEALGAGYIGDLTNNVFGSNYQDVFAFIVLIAVLVFRPSGLLGERVGDRA